MSTKRKFKQLKHIIRRTRPTARGYALNDLNQAFPGLFHGMDKLRTMTPEQIKAKSKDEGNGIMSISLADL